MKMQIPLLFFLFLFNVSVSFEETNEINTTDFDNFHEVQSLCRWTFDKLRKVYQHLGALEQAENVTPSVTYELDMINVPNFNFQTVQSLCQWIFNNLRNVYQRLGALEQVVYNNVTPSFTHEDMINTTNFNFRGVQSLRQWTYDKLRKVYQHLGALEQAVFTNVTPFDVISPRKKRSISTFPSTN